MALQDVSHDSSMIGWLRQSGHGHLLEENRHYSGAHVSSAPIAASPLPPLAPAPAPISVPVQSYERDASYYARGHSYGYAPSPVNAMTTPTQFLAPHANYHYDAEVEHLRRDPNTRIVHRPTNEDVVYKQRVFVKYLQPPTPPVGGTIIVREKQAPPLPPEPPLVIRRPPPPPPPTPPPVVIRERPPAIPPPEPTTIINKFLPPPPAPPRQVIIEQHPPLPPKPRNVIIERWLPLPPRQRRVIYERAPPPICPAPAPPIVVQHGPPRVHIQREVINQPGVHVVHGNYGNYGVVHNDVNQIVAQVNASQPICTTSSSLVAYDPYSSLQQPSYNAYSNYPQSNVIIMQNAQPATLSSSIYGLPMSHVYPPTPLTGLDAYGSGISSYPTVGHAYGPSTVFNVPENVPVDNVLRQLGIEPTTLYPATGALAY